MEGYDDGLSGLPSLLFLLIVYESNRNFDFELLIRELNFHSHR